MRKIRWQKGRLRIAGRTAVDPKPWWQVGLAILPGLVMLVDINLDHFGWQVRLPWPVVASVLVLLALSSIVWAIARRRPLDVGSWGLIPLGLLALFGMGAVKDPFASLGQPLRAVLVLLLGHGFLLAALLVMFRGASWARILPAIGYTLIPGLVVLLLTLCMTWVGWAGIERYTPGQPVERWVDWDGLGLYATLFILVVVGVFPARHQGLTAGLFVLSGGVFLMSWHIEQVIYFWERPTWSALLGLCITVLFYICAPVWVLASRSAWSQAAGLLVPALAYVITLVPALGAARGFSVGRSISIASPAFVLCAALGAASVLYAWGRLVVYPLRAPGPSCLRRLCTAMREPPKRTCPLLRMGDTWCTNYTIGREA